MADIHTINIKLAIFIEPLAVNKTITDKKTFVGELRS